MNIFNELAAAMLESAADEFGNHGCNDLTSEVSDQIKNWSPIQKSYFIQQANDMNNGYTELEIDRLHYMPDWLLMRMLAYILLKESKEA